MGTIGILNVGAGDTKLVFDKSNPAECIRAALVGNLAVWAFDPSMAEKAGNEEWGPTAAFAFRCLWNGINGPEAWNANPWIAAYTFTVHQQNIDALLIDREAA